MGKDKGLAGKNGVSLLNVYLAIPFGTLSHQNTRHTGAVYTNVIRKFNRLPSKGITTYRYPSLHIVSNLIYRYICQYVFLNSQFTVLKTQFWVLP